MDATRNIPEPVKREVRQACFFGCAICGMPVFEYDHVQEFSEVQAHDAENMVLLCPNHHRDKTSRRLSPASAAAARANPFNAKRALSESWALRPAPAIRVSLGSNIGTAPPEVTDYPILWVNGESIVTLHREAGSYTFSARVTDKDGTLLLSVERGALAVSTGVWDFRYEGRDVSIRGGSGDILLQATVADDEFSVRRGVFVGPFETGLSIKADGSAAFTMSGLEIGSIAKSTFDRNAHCMLAIVRGSCCADEPAGGGMLRKLAPEYEQLAVILRARMEAGEPGTYPPGLDRFRPMPR